MDNVFETNKFQNNTLNNIVLNSPSPLQGGTTFLAKISLNDSPIFIQTPKSQTKKGIVINNKRNYCDLLFNNESTIIEWIEQFESIVKDKVFQKKDIWFTEAPTKDELDYMWNEGIKTSKKIFLEHF